MAVFRNAKISTGTINSSSQLVCNIHNICVARQAIVDMFHDNVSFKENTESYSYAP